MCIEVAMQMSHQKQEEDALLDFKDTAGTTDLEHRSPSDDEEAFRWLCNTHLRSCE